MTRDGDQRSRRAASIRSISLTMIGFGDSGIICIGAQNTTVSPNALGCRSDKVLDVSERNAFFLPAAAHEKRVTEIEHFVDQIECHPFDELAEDCQHHRHDQNGKNASESAARPWINARRKNTARKPNQMTGKIRL